MKVLRRVKQLLRRYWHLLAMGWGAAAVLTYFAVDKIASSEVAVLAGVAVFSASFLCYFAIRRP